MAINLFLLRRSKPALAAYDQWIHTGDPYGRSDEEWDALARAGLLFLLDHNGRVTTANLLTYVYGNRTMITLGPSFGHSIARQGRACPDCHGTANARDVAAGTFTLATWADGKTVGARGVVPVADPLSWRIPFLDRKDGVWAPLPSPEPPLLRYATGCAPLTREQLARLATPQKVR